MVSVAERIQNIKSVLPSELKIEGCRPEELARLQTAQQVDCLPEMYRQVMLLMGKNGISSVLDGHANSHQLDANLKRRVTKDNWLKYPKDIFVFFDHQGYQFYFFRTKGCEEDPAIYAEWEGDWFYKLGDCVSDFVLKHLVLPRSTPEGRKYWVSRLERIYYYDAGKDEFYDKPHPDPY